MQPALTWPTILPQAHALCCMPHATLDMCVARGGAALVLAMLAMLAMLTMLAVLTCTRGTPHCVPLAV